MRRVFVSALALALLPAAVFAQDPQQPPATAAPAAAAQPTAPKMTFTGPAGLLLVPIKPDQTAAFEEMAAKLKSSLSASTDESLKTAGAAFKFYKASEPMAAERAVCRAGGSGGCQHRVRLLHADQQVAHPRSAARSRERRERSSAGRARSRPSEPPEPDAGRRRTVELTLRVPVGLTLRVPATALRVPTIQRVQVLRLKCRHPPSRSALRPASPLLRHSHPHVRSALSRTLIVRTSGSVPRRTGAASSAALVSRQLEDPIVQPQPQRARQVHLDPAADIPADVRLGQFLDALAEDATARRSHRTARRQSAPGSAAVRSA